MNKHNWNQLSASSKRYLEQAQNDRMINESYQDGYRQGLSERGPGPGAYASNRQQGQRFDRFGNPIATGGPARSIGPANPFSLEAGDELGMSMQWQMPDDFVPPSLQAKLDAIDPVKNPPPKWTMMPNDPNEDERMYEHYRRRMYEQSTMGAGNDHRIETTGWWRRRAKIRRRRSRRPRPARWRVRPLPNRRAGAWARRLLVGMEW